MKFHVTQMSARRNRGERVYVTGQRNARLPDRLLAGSQSRTVSDEAV